jgi:tetratricopeptide (TPR) repeat protein
VTRDQIIFLLGGLVLGLIIGGTTIGPMVTRLSSAPAPQPAAPAPAAPSDGMPSAAPAAAAAGAPMEAVRRQLDALKGQLAQDPNNVEALVQLGNMYMDVGKFPQAAEYYERAVAVREDPNVRTDLGICYKQSGQLEKALAEFRRVEQLQPQQWQAVYNEVIILGELRRFDEARTRFAALEKMRPGDEEVTRLGQALSAAK